MANTAVVGATGLVGSNILSTLLHHPSVSTVSAFSRRPLQIDDPSSRLRPIVDNTSAHWPSDFSSFEPRPEILFSALGSTRAQAGGFAEQRKIDYDLNLELAQAAQQAGAKIYVLISSAGLSDNSRLPYIRMKMDLEKAVVELGFDKCIILRPGLIVGKRKDFRPPEYVFRMVANFLGKISGNYLKDFWAQDADVIAKAAVSAGLLASQGKAPDGKVWMVGMNEIMRLGRTEWK